MSDRKNKTRIFLAEDHLAVLNALKTVLASEEDFEVVDTATDGETAIKRIKECNPDVVVMDVKMPALNGLKVTERVKKHNPQIEVILISMFDEYKHMVSEVGAYSFVKKGEPIKILVKNIRRAYRKKKQMEYD